MLHFLKKNKEKQLEKSLFYTCLPKISMIGSTVSAIYEIGNFRSFFALLPPKNPKNQKFEKMKNIAGDIIILHICTKNYNHMMYGS